MLFQSSLFLAASIGLVLAEPDRILAQRASNTSSAATSVCTGNTADDRSVWCNYDISTNYYNEGPDTGVTVEYWWNIVNSTIAPNGVSRTALTVNGSLPGPTIEANWGDTVVIHVTNELDVNGTSIHFHGVRQNYTNANDGVPGITQCPTAAGNTVTYTWKATQYGSSWYHSHFSMQAWDGVFGGITIHGPATGNYDHDLGNLFLTDWDHLTASQLYFLDEHVGPPTLDTGLINGTNTNGSLGTRFSTTFESGSSYLLRVVNGAVNTHFDFSIDNHTLSVIATDFVPIHPYTTDVISIGMGQRYDVIVTANQSAVASDFWLRAVPDIFCSNNYNPDDIMGIIHYGDSTAEPTTTAYTLVENQCANEPAASITPYVSLTASSAADVSVDDEATATPINATSVAMWYLGGVSFNTSWQEPTSLLVLNNATSFKTSYAVTKLPTANEWMMLIIETDLNIPHPIHLHGHDFFVLGYGSGTYADSTAALNTNNPPRRDVQMLPEAGYLVLAWQADNPGVWLAHCHIGFHTDSGFALQFVEREDEIPPLYNSTELTDSCNTWDSFQSSIGLVQTDDGV